LHTRKRLDVPYISIGNIPPVRLGPNRAITFTVTRCSHGVMSTFFLFKLWSNKTHTHSHTQSSFHTK
jgi:hypothetical protein